MKTTLQVIRGSGEFQTWETAILVSVPESLQFVWSTDFVGAAGGNWQVMRTSVPNAGQIVASGKTSPAPAAGKEALFSIVANAFLQATPPNSPGVKYSVVITPYDGANQPLGSASPAVTVTQKKETPQPPIQFGPSAVFPDLELVHYAEQIGQVPLTQILYGLATLKVRAVNHGNMPTDVIMLSVSDFNVLMSQQGPDAAVASLKPGASAEVTLKLEAVLPPPKSQLPQEQQFAEWHKQYKDRLGVDLRGLMAWVGPQASMPLNAYQEVSLYKGFGDSTPCQEGIHTIVFAAPEKAVCNGGVCLPLEEVRRHIHQRLDCRVVGYAAFVGQSPKFEAFGKARTAANGPAVDFTPSTKIPVASVSKVVTALAAIKVLAKHSKNPKTVDALDGPIGPYLPKDWKVDPNVASITFAQLLSHKSGVKDYGNNAQDYAKLKAFFTQKVNPNANTSCQGPDVADPKDAIVIDPKLKMNRCYSNYNFSIFRVLLPMIEGFQDTDPSQRAERLANQYVKIVQANVFDPVGAKNVECKPPAGSNIYAFSYAFPGSTPGHDWGDNTLGCGAAGWYLSVNDIAKVLISLNQKDGKVLSDAQFQVMESRQLGWDWFSYNGYRYLEKNGGWGANGTTISTSILIFGPSSPGPAFLGVLFMNSNLTREDDVGAHPVLHNAFLRAVRSFP
jgi:CubicO group peptidase (beta-lactamase class C family)